MADSLLENESFENVESGMTDEQILRVAVTKAVEFGWDEQPLYQDILENFIGSVLDNRYYAIIFSHSFAEAFVKYILSDTWSRIQLFKDSDDIAKYTKAGILIEEGKEIVLTEMVKTEEPLRYLEQFFR